MANLLGAVNQLLPGFSDFKSIPKVFFILLFIVLKLKFYIQIAGIFEDIAGIKSILSEQCKEEFIKYDIQINSTPNSSASYSPNSYANSSSLKNSKSSGSNLKVANNSKFSNVTTNTLRDVCHVIEALGPAAQYVNYT